MAFAQVGKVAPAFSLFDQRGNKVSLKQFRDSKNVVLYFYPKAMTPGCTVQACGIRDSKAEFETLDTVVLAVSPDSVDRLVKFEDKQELNFTLLSDEDHAITDKYGAGGDFNEKVFDYAWNVICLWLIELAGSHKTCNQRKNQYNLMTVGGRNKALARSYDGGAFKTGGKKKGVEDALDTNLDNISKHLKGILTHYEKCCFLYATVSATATLARLSAPDKINMYKRMHIWDNFRRITRYVTVIRNAYWDKMAEDNMDMLKNIVKNKSAKNIKFKDGNMKVDMFTASAITQVFDKVNSSNQQKMAKLINGKKAEFMKIADFALSKVK